MEEEKKDSTSQKKSKINKLERSIKDKYLLGVCGGVSEYFNVDVTIVRILWVFSVFFGDLRHYLRDVGGLSLF